MKIIVQKFGGTSVRTEENRKQALKHVRKALDEGYKPVIVVSAMGRMGDPYATDTLLSLVGGNDARVSKREMDLLLSCGEIISAVVFSNLLLKNGIRATALTGAQAGFRTNGEFTDAKIIEVNCQRLLKELESHDAVVVAGFQGETEDGEVTPVWGAVDIVTGEQTKIWSGFIEQHISADIAFAIYQYYTVTGDREFMERYGYEMVFETAKFWASRLEWNEEKREYHINDVIGPDEYKEHVNNNAFTNYMAHFNIQLAITYYEKLEKENPSRLAELEERLALRKAYEKWKSVIGRIYLPQPREDLVIPQDDTYLSLKTIDLTKYKQSKKVGTLFEDYNLEQVNKMQVSKQADVLILLYLLEQWVKKFSQDVLKANFRYYEPKTLHDSSLSLSTHAILANDIGEYELAYSLFRRAAEIDLGPFPHSSDHGIHAASIGGIWQAAVAGFAGLRLSGGKLRISPRLPKHWRRMEFSIYWKGQPVTVSIDHSALIVKAERNEPFELEVYGKTYTCKDQLTIHIDPKN